MIIKFKRGARVRPGIFDIYVGIQTVRRYSTPNKVQYLMYARKYFSHRHEFP